MGHLRSLLGARPRTMAFNFIAEGDYVVVEARGDNVTKTGVRYDNQYCIVWRIEDGRIKEIKEYCDSALVERVLGPFPEERKLAAAEREFDAYRHRSYHRPRPAVANPQPDAASTRCHGCARIAGCRNLLVRHSG
jgi:hypothetical protein